MADFWKAAGGILGTVAPVLATAVGGPLAGVAARAIAGALGLGESSTEQEIAAAVAGASPDQLLALKQADQEFAARMKELDIDVLRIDAGDRDSARRREISVRDWVPGILAILVTAGFFGVLIYMMRFGVAKDSAGSEAMIVMLGALGAAFGAIVNYYYGSSSGSARKDALLAQAPPR